MTASTVFATVLNAALKELQAASTPVFTFAFYHDHESHAVSVCVDTEENSFKRVLATNRYNNRYFQKAIAEGDLEAAGLWQANVGRNLSLGDFSLVNVARTSLGTLKITKNFYLTMIRSVISVQPQIAALSPRPERLLFACSGADSEVAIVWSLHDDSKGG